MTVNPTDEPIELNRFTPYRVTFLAHQISRRTAGFAKKHEGLNLSHWRVLAAVAEVPGRTANDVVAVTPMDKGIVSRAVKNLIDLGLVSRTGSEKDGRISHLYLTENGQSVYREIASDVSAFDRALRTALTPEEDAALQSALSKMIATIKTLD